MCAINYSNEEEKTILVFESQPIEHEILPEISTVSADNRRIQALEEELRETRESLQTTIEELETSNEELRTVNEEMAVKNAEIEAANEQLIERQRELAQIMRLNTLGAMASGLAHELNQPLAAISNYLTGCEHRVRNKGCQQGEILEVLKLTNTQVKRAGSIINHVKHFIKKDGLETELVDINEAIQNAIELIKGTGQCNHVNIEQVLTKPLALVLANKVQIEQVIINLLLNGAEAMDEASISEPRLLIRSQSTPDKQIEVLVEDKGKGLSAQEKLNVFKPFHSTKVGGMGMGLCISRSIIELYTGQLRVADGLEEGCVFSFILPVG